MKKTLPLIVLTSLLAVGGCASSSPTQTPREEAKAKWDNTRAIVMYGLARDQYQTGNFDKCRTTLADALRIDPTNAKLHVLSGKLAIETNKLELAEQELKLARQFDPKDAEAEYLSGVVCQRWQKPEAAFEFYSHAADKQPSELSYVMAKSEMLVVMGRANEALALLEDKVTYFEHSGIIRDATGQLLMQQNRNAEAIEMLRSAAILANDDVKIREHLALALYADKQYREASDLLTRLLTGPANEKRGDLYLAQAECQLHIGKLGDARGNFELATQIDPASFGAWLGLAQTALEYNDLVRADLAIRHANAINPQSSQLCLLAGYLRLKQNKPNDALASFTRASQIDAADTTSLCMMGFTLEKLGRSNEAASCYARALRIAPKDEMATKLLAAMGSGNSSNSRPRPN